MEESPCLLLTYGTYNNCAQLCNFKYAIKCGNSNSTIVSRLSLGPPATRHTNRFRPSPLLPHIANFLITLSVVDRKVGRERKRGSRPACSRRAGHKQIPAINAIQIKTNINKQRQHFFVRFSLSLSLSFSSSSSSSAASTSCTFLHKIPTILAANAKGPVTATATWECPPKKRETDKNPRKERERGVRERPRSGHFIYCYFISTAN